jgi:quinol monooxygenase YgiN
MTVGYGAVHHPHAAHYDEFVSRLERAVEVMRPAPGCLTADCWVTPAGDAVVSITRWESEAAQLSSTATARAAGVDFDEREARPREVVRLRAQR